MTDPLTVNDAHRDRLEELNRILEGMGSCLLAYSGGVDSTFLLAAAQEALGERCLAVTVHSLFHRGEEVETARRLASRLGARHRVIELDMSAREEVLRNPPDRCYHCKKAIFSVLEEAARGEGIETVIEASHVDDLAERRPGMKALAELGVRSPLREAGFTKAGIRECSRRFGVEGADRPAGPCLATRIPYGVSLTPGRLRRVAGAEELLRGLGFTAPRVRDYDETARIELRNEEMERIADPLLRRAIFRPLRDLGYTYVTVDLEGYRTGSMDEVLEVREEEGEGE
jgi:uncharacterized protein